MSASESRGFLKEDCEEQFNKARPEFFQASSTADTLEDSLYLWASVFYPQVYKGNRWSGKNPAANLTRRMLTKMKVEPFYMDSGTLDDFLLTPDHNLVRETIRQNKKYGRDRSNSAQEDPLPQLHDWTPHTIWKVKTLIVEILALCTYKEKRLFAFMLVEWGFSDILELFEDPASLGEFQEILDELYSCLRDAEQRLNNPPKPLAFYLNQVGKRDFITQRPDDWNKREYYHTLKSFRKKVRPLFFASPEEDLDEQIQD